MIPPELICIINNHMEYHIECIESTYLQTHKEKFEYTLHFIDLWGDVTNYNQCISYMKEMSIILKYLKQDDIKI